MTDRAQNVTTDLPHRATQSIHHLAGTLAKSFAVYGLANFGIRALNFLLVVLYAHYLHPSDYGVIYLAEIVAAFLIIFEGLSIDSSLQRLYFQHHHDAAVLRSYLGSAIRFGFCWMGIFVALIFFAGNSLQSHLAGDIGVPFYPYVALAVASATCTQGVQYRLAIYQAERRPRPYALLSVFLFVLTAAFCIYQVVILQRGALGMLRGKLAAAVIVFLIATWSMRHLLTAPFHWKFVRESLSFSLPLVPHLTMASGLIVADRFILQHYRDVSEVGIYSLAYTLGMVMFLVTQSLSQAWLPMFFELASGHGQNRQALGRICSGLAVFLAAIACLGILISPPFVSVALDSRYHAAARIVPLVVMGYLFHSFFSLFNLSILQAKRTAFVFVASLVAFSANMILNFAMIPRWGMYGAAWATMLAYAVEAAGAYLFAQSFFRLPYRMAEILAGFAIAAAALWLTQSRWTFAWHGLALGFALIVALGLLAVLGRRDLHATILALQKSRKTPPAA